MTEVPGVGLEKEVKTVFMHNVIGDTENSMESTGTNN